MNFISRKDIQRNPEILFVFGDNDKRKGLGGMAKEFRGESNSIGLRTKKLPSMGLEAFFTDKEYNDNIKKIDEDISDIIKASRKYCGIWISESIGCGLAKLDKKAPKTFEYLQQKIKELKKEIDK